MAKLDNVAKRQTPDTHKCDPDADPIVKQAVKDDALADGVVYTCDCGRQHRFQPRAWVQMRPKVANRTNGSSQPKEEK